MNIERQKWKLGEQELFCSLTPKGVDLRDVMDKLLSQKKHHSRYDEVSDLIKQAVAYHMEAGKDAYVELAVRSRSSGLTPFDGWKAEPFASSIASATEFLLTKADTPGGYHVSLRCKPVLTDESQALSRDLNTQIDRELDDLGIAPKERFWRQIMKTPDMTPSEAALKKLEDAPESYREIRSGDRFDKLIVTALNIGGPPPGVTRSDASSLKDIEGKDVDRGYFPGQQINCGPETLLEKEGLLNARSTTLVGGSADVAMSILSGFLVTNGLAPSVIAGSNRIKGVAWRSFGDLESAEIMDVANAVVFESNGLFDGDVVAHIRSFSRGLALHDMTTRCDEFKSLAAGLIEKGFDRPGNAFDANDLRDIGHAVEGDSKLSLFSKTQNGTYRIDLHLDEASIIHRIDAFEIRTGKDLPVGRFVQDNGVWQEDYAGHHTGAEPVDEDIRNVRHMNNLISSFTSLACVFEDEHVVRDDLSPSGM